MKTHGIGQLLRGMLPFREGLFVVNQDGTGYLIANRCVRFSEGVNKDSPLKRFWV